MWEMEQGYCRLEGRSSLAQPKMHEEAAGTEHALVVLAAEEEVQQHAMQLCNLLKRQRSMPLSLWNSGRTLWYKGQRRSECCPFREIRF
jgi:hypothetical protein